MGNKRLIAIDGNSLINRAFYALPPLTTKDGLYTNAVYGFINMLNKIVGQYEPEYFAVAFDRKAPTFRHKEYSEYKAGRKKTPVELLQQFPLIKEVLSAMKIKMLELDGYEADDIIGTVVKRAEEAGLLPYVITGDRDELQLASDQTKIILTKKGITEFELYDREAMLERYQMTPEQFVDLKGLMGDSSDNIPGIPGVGEKTGINLILQFGSVENLLENTDQIKGQKLREKVEENRQLAIMSKRLAQIDTNVPVNIDFQEFLFEAPDFEKLRDIYQRLELFSLISRMEKEKKKAGGVQADMAEAAGESGGISKGRRAAQNQDAAQIQTDSQNQAVIQDRDASQRNESDWEEESEARFLVKQGEQIPEEFYKEVSGCPQAVLKVFGNGLHVGQPEIYGAAVLLDSYFYFDGSEHLREVCDLLKKEEKPLWGHFLKNDYYMLQRAGMKGFHTGFDTAIGHYVLEPQKNDYGIKTLALIYLNREIEEEKDFLKNHSQMDLFSDQAKDFSGYGWKWCSVVKAAAPLIRMRLKKEELEQVYDDIELPLIEIFADMECEGFKVVKEELVQAGKVISEKVGEIAERIYQLAGESFNINSPKQLGVILFEKLGMTGGKKTKTGYSTSADVLEKLKDRHEIIPLILEYRMLTKLNGTYIEGLLPLIDPTDHKIRAHFQQTGTATGRISCTEPNLQNIPVRQEMGRALRKAFVAENEDCILLDADYSQIELRVLAHLSRDEGLLEAFRSGQDIHRSTAARVFDVSEEEVTPLQRSGAKAVNFGVIYGMSGFGLSENLNITRKEAEAYIDEYFKKYESVKAYMEQTVAFCREHGYVKTIFNRRRAVPEIKTSKYILRQMGERLAMNSPIQGSAADIIKLAMIKVYRELKEKGYRSKMILQVHDELLLNVYREELPQVEALLKRNMMDAAELLVPLEVGMDSGENWYEVK